MAEKNEGDDNSFLPGKQPKKNVSDDENITESSSPSLALDLGNGNARDFGKPSSSEPTEFSHKKEDNPFSFKHFLNQGLNDDNNKNKGARRKTYTSSGPSPTVESLLPEPSTKDFHSSRLLSSTEMSSVLPDFVQDHLVVEQCYLNSGVSNINVENLNLDSISDLNLDSCEQLPDFALNSDTGRTTNQRPNPEPGIQNLPDFALNAGHNPYSHDSEQLPDFTVRSFRNTCNEELPDFAVNANFATQQSDTLHTRNYLQRNESVPSSHSKRFQISSSPSVPLDLPLYNNLESSRGPVTQQNQPLPFDLPLSADENISGRGLPSNDSVSKSLPDFLSDGPIRQERFDDSAQDSIRDLNLPSCINQLPEHNGLPGPELAAPRSDFEILQRELETTRRQFVEKNRRIEILESEIHNLRSRDRRETVSLGHALQQVELTLQQTMKRAITAETNLAKLKQENKTLKSAVATLKSENRNLHLGVDSCCSKSQNAYNQSVAQDLRLAASTAENSLRSLLSGVENLRLLAAAVENLNRQPERTDDYSDFNYEDAASGPAL